MDLQKNNQTENQTTNTNNNSNNFSNNFNNNFSNENSNFQNIVLSDTDKLLVLASHLGGIFFGFIPAFIAYILRKDTPGFAFENAKEALNWQITIIIGSLISGVLAFILIGFLLLGLIWIANIIFCLIATFKSSNKELYRYPLCLRLIK